MSDLESELEFELHRVLDSVAAMPIPARRVVAPRGRLQRLLGSTGAALAIKVASGLAVAAAATTIAGAATTGSLNPTDWGQHVSTAVDTCKSDLQGQHGIGACVSDIANQHGAAVSNAARQHGNANGHSETGNGSAPGSSSDQGQGKDKGKTHNPPKGR